MVNRLALGTVQFGQAYGIANIVGQVMYDEAARILDYAGAAGIDTIDTAIAYGDAEKRLGDVGVKGWRVISKLSDVPPRCDDVHGWVHASVVTSLQRLKIDRLAGLLLHRSAALSGPASDALFSELCALKEEGLVEKIGVSIYDPDELAVLWPRYKLDLVQAPLNVLDRRLITTGWLKKLSESNMEIHTRSVFLQGLLLLRADQMVGRFASWRMLWQQWHKWLEQRNVTAVQACLHFPLRYSEVGRVIVGVDTVEQLKEIVASCDVSVADFPDELRSDDLDLISPDRWRNA